MRILCTGAAGFIGSHLGDALAESHAFFGCDTFLTGREENWPDAAPVDVTDRKTFYEFANELEPELVIHCAASYSDPDKWHRDTETNVLGGINATLVAKHHNAHMIYFQTILPPVSSYAISKIAAERYMILSGVPLTILRLANIYGPRNLSGPIPSFYKRLTAGEPCTVVDTSRDMVFIDDLVDAVLKVVDGKLTGTFDVCTGVQVPIFAMYERIMNELGLVRLFYDLIPPDPDDVQGFVLPKNGVPGWKATTPLRDGIAKTVASYRESGVTETHTHLRLKG